MQTYVINTSENRNFDSNLLFSLARYEQIQWISCSLNDIKTCAEEIFEKEDAKIPFRDYRVVVLVDFFNYPHSVHSENNSSPGDYIEIYKFFIEHYLLTNLFEYLKKQDVPAKYCEIYYIQYTKYEPIFQNEKEKEQAAQLFDMEKEAEYLKAKRSNLNREKSQTSEISEADFEKRTSFRLRCSDPSAEKPLFLEFPVLDITEDTAEENRTLNFFQFYDSYKNFHGNDAKKFPIIVHEPYETHGNNPVRAAYDTLTLSLYLIHLYERRDDISPDQRICSPDPNILADIMIKAYQKIHSARKISQNDPQNNPTRYYSLAIKSEENESTKTKKAPEDDFHIWSSTPQNDVFAQPDHNAKNREAALQEQRERGDNIETYSYAQLYDKVLYYVNKKPGVLTKDEISQIDILMHQYQEKRDLSRDRSHDQDTLDMYSCNEMECPTEETRNAEINQKKELLRKHLEEAIDAEYMHQNYAKEKRQAEAINERYQYLLARLRGKWYLDLLTLLLAVLTPLVSYIVIQHTDTHYSLLSVGLVTACFSGVFLLMFFLRIIPLKWEMRYLKGQMRKVCESCMGLYKESFSKLEKRYKENLLEIEKLRYDIRLIECLHEMNQEKNRHIEMNQIMLERVEDVLVGILNCFHYPHSEVKDVDVRDCFDIEKPFHDPSNTIYRILSIETIDSIFNS
ncbi:MAG: hypothetical protein IJW87_05385 [Clostridia bacterium]|nr:hypothetical protein [Clostridia bacterium]